MGLERTETLEQHLKTRRLEVDRYTSVYLDEERRIITFLVWNLSGQLVGFQKYRPDDEKLMKNSEEVGRYYTFFSPEDKKRMLGVWGLETFNYRDDVLCFTEGVFDAAQLHRFNLPAAAVFSNDPKPIRPWLTILPRRLIGFRDNDDAGKRLEKYMDECVVMTEKDLGDSTDQDINSILKHKGLIIE